MQPTFVPSEQEQQNNNGTWYVKVLSGNGRYECHLITGIMEQTNISFLNMMCQTGEHTSAISCIHLLNRHKNSHLVVSCCLFDHILIHFKALKLKWMSINVFDLDSESSWFESRREHRLIWLSSSGFYKVSPDICWEFLRTEKFREQVLREGL
jgi:hypothetical protein